MPGGGLERPHRLLRQAAVVEAGAVEGRHGVVPRHPVLGDQGGGGRLRVAREEHVVSDAQAHDHVQLAAGAVEQFRLRDRVADRLEGAGDG